VRTIRRVAPLAAAAIAVALLLQPGASDAETSLPQPSLGALVAQARQLSNQVDSLSQQFDGLQIQIANAKTQERLAKLAAARALTLLSLFQPMAPGDLLLTGTPGGTALKAPAKLAGLLAGLLPPATRWKLFFGREAANPRYLRDGDVITATIASPDGRLDLGTQRTTVIGKTP